MIVAGSRSIYNYKLTLQAVKRVVMILHHDTPKSIMSGMAARGPDSHAGTIAIMLGLPLIPRPAKWFPNGKNAPMDRGAGFKRNAQMAVEADLLTAMWDGESRGTAHMICAMLDLRKPVYVFNVGGRQYDVEEFTEQARVVLARTEYQSREAGTD
jgi:hypothetical protein